ncbi:MAG: transposase [Oscillospiraceae bacterium]|nr:transposase [Oscillospiraceae bacterium]
MKELPQRKKNRLQGYDYSQSGAYFITICTKNRKALFGAVENSQMILNEIGKIVKQEIEKIPTIREECVIHEYIVMPNHVHMIVEIKNTGDNPNYIETQRDDCHRPVRRSIPNMVQGLKGAVTRRLGFSPWHRNYHDHIIRNDKEYTRIAEYIINNPVKWNEDRFYI